MTVQIISQKWDPKLQVDVVNYAGLSTDVKPTILTPGSTFHESDTGDDYLSGALGWTAKPAAGSLTGVQSNIATLLAFERGVQRARLTVGDNIVNGGDPCYLLALMPQAVNTGAVTIKDGATTELIMPIGALTPGVPLPYFGARFGELTVSLAGAVDVLAALYIPEA